MKPPGWDYGEITASTAPGTAECGRCGNVVDAGDVCCSDFVLAPDGLMEYDGATCRGCCHPHSPNIWDGKSVAGGTYERCE